MLAHSHTPVWRRYGGSLALWLCFPGLLAAQQFRVETEIFLGEQPEAASRTVTLFEKSAVYHFVEQPAEVVIFRRSPGQTESQFTLLDVAKQRRTDVPTPRVAKLVEKLGQWAAQQEDPLIKFSGQPSFDEKYDEATGALTLSHPLWTYQVATIKAEQPEALLRYREFMDEYARLTCLQHNVPPPGPRLALNHALAQRGLTPVEISRVVSGEKDPVRAVHLFSWRLSRDDQERIDDAREKIANFAKVTNEAFRGE